MILQQNFPEISAPFVDPKSGQLSQSGFALLRSLWNRTGEEPGVSSEGLEIFSVLNATGAKTDQSARVEAATALLAALQPPGPATDPIARQDAVAAFLMAAYTACCPTDATPAQTFAMALQGPPILPDSGVVPGTYGDSSHTAQVTFDRQGRAIHAEDVPISGAALEIQDEGTPVDSAVSIINFTGAGVAAVQTSPGVVDVDVPGGGGGFASGTSFPVSPSNNDLFYRTDWRVLFVYDGANTRWISADPTYLTMGVFQTLFSGSGMTATNTTIWFLPNPFAGSGRSMVIEEICVPTFTISADNTANFMTFSAISESGAGNTPLTGLTFSTTGDAVSEWVNHRVSGLNTVVADTQETIRAGMTKTGTITGHYNGVTLKVREIG